MVKRFEPVVELVVARYGKVIAEAVHHFDNLGAFRDGPDGRTLDGVAGIDQQNVVINLFELFPIQGQAVVADVVLEAHMHVVRVQDHRRDLIGIIGRSICEGEGGKQTAARQQTGKKQDAYRSFHTFTPPSNRPVRPGCRC